MMTVGISSGMDNILYFCKNVSRLNGMIEENKCPEIDGKKKTSIIQVVLGG